MSNYERVRITGSLCCESELHIGSATIEQKTIIKQNSQGKEVEHPPIEFANICLDHQGFPYLPSTTLRGFFTKQLEAMRVETELQNELFGYSSLAKEEREESGDLGQMGCLRVYDARWQHEALAGNKPQDVMVRSHVKLDSITGTAKAHALFSQRVVPKGTLFDYQLELDKPSKQAIDVIALLLMSLKGEGTQKIGKGQSYGLGRLSHHGQPNIEVLTKTSLCDWLVDKSKDSLHYQAYREDIDFSLLNISSSSRLGFKIHPQSPLLIHDGVHGYEYSIDKTRDFYAMRQNGLAVIPGSTIKGAVKAHCRKILLTLVQHNNQPVETENKSATEKWVDHQLAELFGSTEKGRGCLLFDDAVEDVDVTQGEKPEPVHHQYFNAIDRFTGGAADGALFSVEACFPNALKSQITLTCHFEHLPDWIKGLMVYLCRDAIEGDFAVGWGKSKGYGALKVVFDDTQSVEDWQQIVQLSDGPEWLTYNNLELWGCALYTHLQDASFTAKQPQEA